METTNKLFLSNKAWAMEKMSEDADYFKELANDQRPAYLWIGCSDSRVPANEIVNLPPGAVFVQRNIANQVGNTDMNLLSVVYYAVKYLKVRQIVVVGHYGCGGVLAAMSNQSFGFLDNWLVGIKNVYSKYQDELDAIDDMTKRGDRMVELNVIEQARNLAKISFIQEEWQNGAGPQIHAMVYSLKDGRLRNLDASIENQDDIRPVYHINKFD